MNAIFNTSVEFKPYNARRKSATRLRDSYRIFHITRKQREDSDDDDVIGGLHRIQIIRQDHDFAIEGHKKSFKVSDRHGVDGWKRRSTKNKRLLFLHKTSCESTSCDAKTPPSSSQATGDLSPSIISNDAAVARLLKKDKRQSNDKHNVGQSFESDVLVEAIDETVEQSEVILDNLLARADQLETNVKSQEFNKIQRISRTSIQRKRKRFVITCTTVLITLTIIITFILFGMIMILRSRTQVHQVTKPSSIYDSFR